MAARSYHLVNIRLQVQVKEVYRIYCLVGNAYQLSTIKIPLSGKRDEKETQGNTPIMLATVRSQFKSARSYKLEVLACCLDATSNVK
ncbi:hypothetical protein L917_04151 [Phytophthora nicotianae]|uniref:Uncharacterized protein n=1 Tax=Phytophthora nicotianae TaxID=4792 RepID=W2LMX4_PHYNI|nr:hypothetical protein L917_04151 [Phytophthora nicotianae]